MVAVETGENKIQDVIRIAVRSLLSRCTILDILQQQRHNSSKRAEPDVEDEIDHFFQLERLFALEDVHFVFLYV